MTDPLATIRRRLEKFELEHLRTHCNELAARIEPLSEENEALRDEISRAWENGNAWHERFFDLYMEINCKDLQVGMTKDGEVGVLA